MIIYIGKNFPIVYLVFNFNNKHPFLLRFYFGITYHFFKIKNIVLIQKILFLLSILDCSFCSIKKCMNFKNFHRGNKIIYLNTSKKENFDVL